MTDRAPAVRILPMSTAEPSFRGRSIDDVQTWFFLAELPFAHRGEYHYVNQGLAAEPGTVVLFQYDKRIVAAATLREAERFAGPRGGFAGVLRFFPESIRVFDPVDEADVRAAWPTFKRFNRVKQHLDPARWPAFARRLTNVTAPPRSA
jgi:hypothetical protein